MIYEVIVTRDITESTFITVEADNEDDAKRAALSLSEGVAFRDWQRDDATVSDGYVTGCDEGLQLECNAPYADGCSTMSCNSCNNRGRGF